MRFTVSFTQLLYALTIFILQIGISYASDIDNEENKVSNFSNKPPQLTIIDITTLNSEKDHILKRPVAHVKFPLSHEDLLFIEALKLKVIELGAGGLAAPQVGINKSIISYQVQQEVLLLREDVCEILPLNVLINPSYEPLEDKGRNLDWEGCFSAPNLSGKVWRYKVIRYKGFTINGTEINGTAVGYLARLLQHEIDHCNGNMCIHKYFKQTYQGNSKELKLFRLEEIHRRKKEVGLEPDHYFPLISP